MQLNRFRMQTEEQLAGKGKASYQIDIDFGHVTEYAQIIPENAKDANDIEYLCKGPMRTKILKPIADHAVREHMIAKLRDLRVAAVAAYEELQRRVG